MTYDEARSAIADELERAAEAPEGPSDEVFDRLDAHVPRGRGVEYEKLLAALSLLEGWIDARNHDWRYHAPIQEADWPRMASSLADDLRNNREIGDPQVARMFGGHRVEDQEPAFTDALRRTLCSTAAAFALVLTLLVLWPSRTVFGLGGLLLLGISLAALVASLRAGRILRARPESRTRLNIGCTAAGALPAIAVCTLALLMIITLIAGSDR